MKKILSLLTAVLLLITVAVAQKRETREVPAFTKIAFRTAGNIYLKQGDTQKVEVEGSAETLDKIKTVVENGRLSVGPEEKGWFEWNSKDSGKLNVYITVPSIEALSVSGSGNLIAQTKIKANDLDLNVSGSGSLQAEIDAAEVDADVSGSGNITITGKCKSFESHVSGSGKVKLDVTTVTKADFSVSGSGRIEASGVSASMKASISGSGRVLAANLKTDRCEVRISGSGDVEINVQKELDARISGSGSVRYSGNPSQVNSHSSGSGSVKKM